MARKSYSISFKNSVLDYLQNHSGSRSVSFCKSLACVGLVQSTPHGWCQAPAPLKEHGNGCSSRRMHKVHSSSGCIYKLFKAHICEKYDEWMSGSNKKEYTKARGSYPGGNLKPPNKELIVKWVVDAWRSKSESCIRDSFKTCALTTTVGGSEDELIHCLKSGQPCLSACDLLQKCREEGEEADLANIAEDFADPAPLESFQDEEDSSSDEIVEDISESSEESDAECQDDDPFSDEEHPWIDTNQ